MIWAKTFALWMLLVVGLGLLGSYLGSWFTPTILAVARDGWAELERIRVSNHAAQLPDWVGEPGTAARLLAAIAYLVSVLGGLVIFGTFGDQLYQHAVVRLGWLTEEEADEARRNEKQYF